MFHLFMVKEAIHSVAMEHQDDCDCTTCRASKGDLTALAAILTAINLDAAEHRKFR